MRDTEDLGVKDEPSPDAFDLHRESVGEGTPPVILIHGLGAHSHGWRKWLPHLAPRHRTHALDLAGFGRAPVRDEADYAPAAQVRRIANLVRRLDAPAPVLVGHSLGAGIALLATLALQDDAPRHRPSGLIIVSGAVYAQKLPLFLTLARMPLVGELFLLGTPPRAALTWGIRRIVHDPAVVDRPMVEGYRAPLRSRRRRAAILRAARQLDLEEADLLEDRLAEVDVPALLIWGEEDPVVSPELGVRLARALPKAELVTLSGVGHLPPEEAPLKSVELALSFLSGLGRSGLGDAHAAK